MEYIVLTVASLLLAYGTYVAVAASYLIVHDLHMSFLRKTVHLLVIWLAPIIGALVVLRFTNDHSPELIDSLWLPWPTGWVVRAEPVSPKILGTSLLVGFLGQAVVGYVLLSIVFFGWPSWAMIGPYESAVGTVVKGDGSQQFQEVRLDSGELVQVYIPRTVPRLEGERVVLIRPLSYPFTSIGYIFQRYQRDDPRTHTPGT